MTLIVIRRAMIQLRSYKPWLTTYRQLMEHQLINQIATNNNNRPGQPLTIGSHKAQIIPTGFCPKFVGFRLSDPIVAAKNLTQSCRFLPNCVGFRRYPDRNPITGSLVLGAAAAENKSNKTSRSFTLYSFACFARFFSLFRMPCLSREKNGHNESIWCSLILMKNSFSFSRSVNDLICIYK
jgi:hypothetical protein